MNSMLTLWGEDDFTPPPRPKAKKGSASIVFHDYESFLQKFTENPKTTDDCYTPPDVYEAVVSYVGTITDMTDKVVLRPFFPGGDYENADYPENGVVIDNPPFSLFAKIVKFYTLHKIPFFLFGPGLTIGNVILYCTVVIISQSIVFENGANVACNFATNLMGDIAITTAPELNEMIRACASQKPKPSLPQYGYPHELLSVSDLRTICNGGLEFSLKKQQIAIMKNLDNFPESGGFFGHHFLVSKAAAKKAAAKKAAAKKAAAKKAAAKNIIPISLSKREERIVDDLAAYDE